ncbi:hypothetical protein GQX73_g9351 [Xylaria multiplex]|uniref:O-methyltransferase domain-containing protein n=1 Tax=Xylaria multiplex TaxID=323545 RepID=A0A7C8MS44_9PEZI|nr:hypothetical protein GQX73_g9351 [Xylaria multiplex]
MNAYAELQKSVDDIANSTSHLIEQLKKACHDVPNSSFNSFPSHLDISSETHGDLYRAKQNVLSCLKEFQTYLTQPTDFIQQIAGQCQTLACLRWLGDFQVLPCIPLSESASIKDIADLTGVSDMQLSRIVRTTAMAGFLREPMPGLVAHTELSARFVTKHSFLDAVMFLAETGAPVALQTSVATRLQGRLGTIDATTPYTVALNTSRGFQVACEQSKKLRRQWLAFSRCGVNIKDDFTETLGQLDWFRTGDARIVDVCASSSEAVVALAKLWPKPQFIFQMSEPTSSIGAAARTGRSGSFNNMEFDHLGGWSSRISFQRRSPRSPQAVRDATVYMFRVPTDDLGFLGYPQVGDLQILPELWAHLSILKANRAAAFILLVQVLPDPGSVDADIEETARLRDLWKMQLINRHEIQVDELTEMINGVNDGLGRLVVANKRESRSSATVAFVIKYEDFPIIQQALDQ